MSPFYLIGIIVMLAGISLAQYNILIGSSIAILGVVVNIIYIWARPKYPVKAMIFMKRHGNYRIVFDKASRIETDRDSGTFKYRFQKQKTETKAAKFENLYPSGQGETALFYSPAPGEYYQACVKELLEERDIEYEKDGKMIKETIKEAAIKPIPDELLEWMVLKNERAKQRYEKSSMWEKYYPFIVAAVMLVLMAVVISVVFTGVKPTAESWERAGSSFDNGASKIADAIEKLIAYEKGEQIVDKNVPSQSTDLPPPPPDA